MLLQICLSFLSFNIFLVLSSGAKVISELEEDLFPLEIIHINDFHARYDEINAGGRPCKKDEECMGGYARMITIIKQLKAKHADKSVLYLNAGDNFVGTLWYTLLRWNVTSSMLNLLPADAITLGNHEFDDGVEGILPFMKNSKTPIVLANVDDSQEPSIKEVYKKSIVLERNNRKIGIIGVITKNTQITSKPGKLVFLDEVTAVKQEAEALHKNGINIIIVLSHCGLDVDKIIAETAGPYIDVIVGGHTHSFLYTGDNPPGPDKPNGTYPIVVEQNPIGSGQEKRKVYIVQASSYSKYVGDLQLYFDKDGNIQKTSGNPVFVSNKVEPDPETVKALEPWKKQLNAIGQKPEGESRVKFDKYECNDKECIMGDLITDSFVHAFVGKGGSNEWTYASIALQNVGNTRSSLMPGVITYADLIGVLPFQNKIIAFDLRGDKLLEALEYAATEETTYRKNMLQVSGLKVTFNMTNPRGSRVVKIKTLCQSCKIPAYEPFDVFKVYRIITLQFLADGGDGFTWFKDFGANKTNGGLDIDALTNYVRIKSPLDMVPEDRLTFL